MKRLTLLLVAAMLMASCKAPSKALLYEKIYNETPVHILVAEVQDNSFRKLEKTPQDEVENKLLDSAALFMRSTLIAPLYSRGYDTVSAIDSSVTFRSIPLSNRELRDGDIGVLGSKYGFDAVLLTYLHKWQRPGTNEVVVFAEYILRSTKSGYDLMHTWVRGDKMQPVDTHGEALPLSTDTKFIHLTAMQPDLAYRCILLRDMSTFVLRNLPTSASKWYFKKDRYFSAAPEYYGFNILVDGSFEQSKYSEDEFGTSCFSD